MLQRLSRDKCGYFWPFSRSHGATLTAQQQLISIDYFVLVCDRKTLEWWEKGALPKMGSLGVHVSLRPAGIRHWMLLAKPVAQPLTRSKKQGNEHTGSSTRIRSKIIEQIVHVSYKFWCGNKRLHQIFTPDGGATPGTPSLSLSKIQIQSGATEFRPRDTQGVMIVRHLYLIVLFWLQCSQWHSCCPDWIESQRRACCSSFLMVLPTSL